MSSIGPSAPARTGATSRPAPSFAIGTMRFQMSGWSRSTAATRAPHRINDGSGPISAPAPSTATVCPSSRSQSGLSSTWPIASPTVGSMIPALAQASSRRRIPVPRSRSPW